MKRKPMSRETRALLWDRCQGYCEACGYTLAREDMQAHHRKLRSHGGKDDLGNLLAVHGACHTGSRGIHMNPTRSYRLGHLVPSSTDPADVPVEIYPHMYATPWVA